MRYKINLRRRKREKVENRKKTEKRKQREGRKKSKQSSGKVYKNHRKKD